MDRFVIVTEDGEVYGPWDSEFEAENWANTSIYVDFTVELFDKNRMVETNRNVTS